MEGSSKHGTEPSGSIKGERWISLLAKQLLPSKE
jgi:hypothetical protein